MNRSTSAALIAALILCPAVRAQTEIDPGGETEAAADTPASVKTFDELSPGNRKIARALMDAQQLPGDSSAEMWTLDQIAVSGSEKGWGRVFQEMQSEGLVSARNLGHVVSSYEQNSHTVVSAGGQNPTASQNSAAGEHARNHTAGNVPGTVSASSLSASASTLGITHANANALGHRPELPVSAGQGISTAAGTGASVGINHALDAGANTGAGSQTGLSTGINNSGSHIGAGAGVTGGISASPAISTSAVGVSAGGAVNAAGNLQGNVPGHGK